MAHSKDELLSQIAEEESRLVELENQQKAAQGRLASLRGLLAVAHPAATSRVPLLAISAAVIPTTQAEKVSLFRSLFRGREEVFPSAAEPQPNTST